MSVLIDGIMLPKNENIYITLMPQGAVVTAEKGSYYSRPKVKEIPEPHGRLIDADALHYSRIRIAHNDGTIGGYNAVVMSAEIKDAPTIIEAEE